MVPRGEMNLVNTPWKNQLGLEDYNTDWIPTLRVVDSGQYMQTVSILRLYRRLHGLNLEKQCTILHRRCLSCKHTLTQLTPVMNYPRLRFTGYGNGRSCHYEAVPTRIHYNPATCNSNLRCATLERYLSYTTPSICNVNHHDNWCPLPVP
jgi:hypothetical protein